MNERHQYEKHLAEKLQQLSPPDNENRRWEQMRALLDKEMPRGGGFGGNGRSGNGRWWITGIITLILISGTWFVGRKYFSGDQGNNTVAGTRTNQDAANKETASSSGVSLSDNKISNKKSTADEVNSTKHEENNNNNNNPVATNNKDNNNSSIKGNSTRDNNSTNLAANEGTRHKDNYSKSNSNTRQIATGNSVGNERERTGPGKIHGAVTPKDLDTAAFEKPTVDRGNRPQGRHHTTNGNKDVAGPEIKNQGDASLPSHPERAMKPSPVKVQINYTASIDISPATLLGDSVEKSLVALLQADSASKKAAIAQKNVNKTKEDISFAGGFSLPLVFPLGDQQALGLNYRAGPNTISDYLPALHFQYHFNGNTYLQVDVQPLSPQYIQPILLYQNKKEIPFTGTNLVTSIYARKLYYFNVPITLFHSPLKNFYMGAGLQLSSFISGIALSDARKVWQGGQDSLIGQSFYRFKHDSLSSMITSNEIRLVLDINYSWNKFKVGFRYNQGFGNFVNFKLNSYSPYTIEKNKSLQFYMGFNLWEEKRKKNKIKGNKPLLTFK